MTVAHTSNAIADLSPYELAPGLVARAVHGERITVAVMDLDAGLVLSPHQHPNEQVGIVLRGEMTFTIGDETLVRRPGDTWVIPPGVPHEVIGVGPQGCTVIETFSPPRDDWESVERSQPRAGDWP